MLESLYMANYQIYLGVFAVIIEIVSYIIYFVGIFKGKTKPHAFTWFIWGILNTVTFLAVMISGGEAGAWVLGVNALACFTISIIGFRQNHVKYDMYDWLALTGAFIGIFLWWLTDNPLYAVILMALSDMIGSIPIYRKAYQLPFEENATSFAVGILYYPLSILALGSLTLTTWLYPAVVILIDGTLLAIIMVRRKQVEIISSPHV